MSDTPDFGFSKFIPGFDFLKNLSQATPPSASGWVAPTLSVEEIDKRISELKAVQFWLEQNGAALKATIQALEVQKMTLSTLRGMNVDFSRMADAFKVKPESAAPAAASPAPEPAAEPAPEPASPRPSAKRRTTSKAGAPAGAAPGVVDPMQWWGALSRQFQEIAASAIKSTAQPAEAGAAASVPRRKKAAPPPWPVPPAPAAAGRSPATKTPRKAARGATKGRR